MEEKRTLIEPEHLSISLARQCELVGLARSSYYYQPVPESEENLRLLRRLGRAIHAHAVLWHQENDGLVAHARRTRVNHKRVARLLRQMGLMAVYPAPRLSQPGEPKVRYPYWLRGMSIERVNHVWSTDITYIRMPRGFLYLVAIIDWKRPLCARLANVDHVGNSVLSRGARAGL